MKTKITLLLFAAGISLFGCKEKGPAINFGSPIVASDTTYMVTSIPAAQKRVVLVEEFTGAKCPNCPDAKKLLESSAAQNSGQLVVMELHSKLHPLSHPVPGSKYDLQTDDAAGLQEAFYLDQQGIPSAGISRLPVNNVYTLSPGDWANAINNLVNVTPAVNLTVKSTYDASSKNATIVVTVTYTQPVSKQQFLSLAILEDDITDIQQYPTYFDNNYKFMHTLRDLITPVSGDEFLKDMPVKDAGRVYERTFIYPVNAPWNPDKCKVVAFVHNNEAGSKEVLQAGETELKGQ